MNDASVTSSVQESKKFHWKWFFKAAGITLGIFGVIIYFYLCPALNLGLYNAILLHPKKETNVWLDKEVGGHRYSDVSFPSKNRQKLHGWYFANPNAKYTFLFLHGNGQNISYRKPELELLLSTGSNVFIFDYQGYGFSQGYATMPNVLEDAQAAYDHLVNVKKISPKQIVLFGESLGTVVASDLSTKVDVQGVVLQCPLASVQRRGCEIFPVLLMYPDFCWPAFWKDNIAPFRKKHKPLLLIAGTIDYMVPIGHADAFYAAASEPKQFVRIDGAGHTGDPHLVEAPAYKEALTKFLADLGANNEESN